MHLMIGHSNCCERKKEISFGHSVPDFFYADINECKAGKHNCAANGNCQNTEGSFVCTCKPGYSGDGVSCTGENNTSVFFRMNFFLINFSYVTLKPSLQPQGSNIWSVVPRAAVGSFTLNYNYRNALAYCYGLWFALTVCNFSHFRVD